MDHESHLSRFALAATVLSLFLLSFPLQLANGASPLPEGSQGISYSPTVPIDKVTIVNMDEQGIYDDFGYIASVPASVFNSRSDDRTMANPVIFYQPPRTVDDEQRTLNTYPGVNYFMEDMVTVSEGSLDRIELVGFGGKSPGEVGSTWMADSISQIDGKDPYETSARIALANWAYTDNAVVVPIVSDPKTIDVKVTGTISGTTPGAAPESGSITGSQEPSPTDPNFHEFEVGPDFKYITSQLTWGQAWNPLSDITERGKDPDLQLYSEEIGQVGASEKWNVLEGASEEIDSYLYNPGGWQFAVTYMPTKSPLAYGDDPYGWGAVPPAGTVSKEGQGHYKTERLRALMADRASRGLDPDLPGDATVEYVIDYTLYPGVDVPEKVVAPFYCRDATFTLEWSEDAQSLGLILRGPEGAEIAVANAATGSPKQVLEVPQLGEGEYQLSVINLGTNAAATQFTITYNMRQAKDPAEADSWAGAVNGAVLASQLNAPVLFSTTSEVPGEVGDAINTLGVKKVYLVDPGQISGKGVLKDIDKLRGFIRKEIEVESIRSYDDLYGRIHDVSSAMEGAEAHEIVFTTMDGWTSWDVLNSRDMSGNPKGEVSGALFLGPAALSGAFHGAPVLVTEAHPELSCAQAWHNEFWKYAYHNGRAPPSVACMILTGKEVYGVLDSFGLDVKQPVDENGKCMESIVTVADQFDIGSAWDRSLVGAAKSGRIMGHPTDASVWVSRSGMYDKLIYANPAVNSALDENDGMRLQGSSSTRIGGKLVITEPETETQEPFAVAETWVSYQYKFNEQASYYWGTPYTTRTGITPFFDGSSDTDPDGIDLSGVYPDLDSSEIVPHYLDALGYGQAFTTTFEKTTENLNRGVIMWLEVMHGGHTESGVVGWWQEDGATEGNPWRGYEENGVPLTNTQLLRLRGATDNPDVSTMSKHVGLDITPGFGPGTDAGIIPEHHDGVVIAISQQSQTGYTENGLVMDDAFTNLHSMGFSGGSCLIANTYLHLMMVRHGSVFQVIDPWLTSWYSAFAMNMFLRDIYYGYSVGEAYERGIAHVGIEYLIDGWWWDIFENLVYYGDPDIHVFTPKYAWDQPASLAPNSVVGGHAPFGPKDHPHATDTGLIWDLALFTIIIGAIGAGAYVLNARRKGIEIPLLKKIPALSRPKKA